MDVGLANRAVDRWMAEAAGRKATPLMGSRRLLAWGMGGAAVAAALLALIGLRLQPHAGRGKKMAARDYSATFELTMARKDVRLMLETAGVLPLATLPHVEQVIRVGKPYKLVARELHTDSTVVYVGGVPIDVQLVEVRRKFGECQPQIAALLQLGDVLRVDVVGRPDLGGSARRRRLLVAAGASGESQTCDDGNHGEASDLHGD